MISEGGMEGAVEIYETLICEGHEMGELMGKAALSEHGIELPGDDIFDSLNIAEHHVVEVEEEIKALDMHCLSLVEAVVCKQAAIQGLREFIWRRIYD